MIQYLTVLKAVELYGKSAVTIRRWILAGKLPAKKDPGGRGWLVIVKNDVSQEGISVQDDTDIINKNL